MNRNVELSTTFAALVLAVTALAGCTATEPDAPEPDATEQASAPAAVADPVTETRPTPEATEPETCPGLSEFVSYTDEWSWERRVPLRDLGAREFAEGEVAFGEDGTPSTYTVAPGDVVALIAERLCAYPNLDSMNHVRMIQPGQVLWLNPDPGTPWVPYFSPMDAEAGFQQIPYQQAIEAAGAAVDAGDIEAVRTIWNETLSDMFTNQDTIDVVQKAVDSGDPDALRQLFS